MHFLIIAAFALGLPAVLAYEAPSASYTAGGSDLQSLVNLAAYNGKGSSYNVDQVSEGISSYGDQHRIGQWQNEYQSVGDNDDVSKLENSASIAESLALQNFVNNAHKGHVKFVAPNEIEQISRSSVLVPSNPRTVVTYTKKLPTVLVNIPGSGPVVVDTGKPALIKTNAIVFKLKPEFLQTTQIVKNIPNPINYSPLYVKVVKHGAEVDTKAKHVGGASHGGSSHGGFSHGGSSHGGSSHGGSSHGGSSYGSFSYGSGPSAY